MFLRDYLLNRMWIYKDNNKKWNADEYDLDELVMDEEAVESQEDYDTKFPHEELEDDCVMGFSRKVEEAVRQQETARARQRQKEERMKISEIEDLKNLKKQEINEKLQNTKQIGGSSQADDCLLGGAD
ncbi:hypothetical protein SAY87_031263 [Trapa incisa]|uniref:Uncharacterized protein n=1 Tax=Trapa incisa TaxID=236973 RepID=A0AAN7QL99_9MYRT|nr:hypothetical protein SAY87_031263 [Trapa incisa]